MIKQNKWPAIVLAVLLLTACSSAIPPQASENENASSASTVAEVQEDTSSEAPLVFSEESAREEVTSATTAEKSVPPAVEPVSSAGESAYLAELQDGDSVTIGAMEESSNGMTAVNITIGNAVFSALFYDNEASKSLISQMPLTVDMADLNRNEKYYHFSNDLHSTGTERPDIIYAGEIMCWSGNSLVLFYDTFSNSYSGYVKIGYIEDINGLAAAVGTGNITVTFQTA